MLLCAAVDARPQASRPGAPLSLIPVPAHMALAGGRFAFTPETRIAVVGDAETRAVGEYLAQQFAPRLGRTLEVVAAAEGAGQARDTLLLKQDAGDTPLGSEGYALDSGTPGVVLTAPAPAGLFYGVQTLRQLLAEDEAGTVYLPGVTIRDAPRYRWRGMLLDCGRHFMRKEFVLRYIDLLAYHKLNVLHWHLTEDQGWRIEIRKYPKLTEIAAWRKVTRCSELPGADGPAPAVEGMRLPPAFAVELPPERVVALAAEKARYGGFYTQADIREIVAYAKRRYVTVVPEIELPGHCQAALAAYPELSCTGGPFEVGTKWGIYEDVYCAGHDATFTFLEDVLNEVVELFPSEFIHIGGDECPKERWRACPRCQARMKAEGLRDEHELQSYFVRRIERFLHGKGRRLIGWDEILEGGLAPRATVQSWRGMDGALHAARAGHDVIASPFSHCYLDYPQMAAPGEPAIFHVMPLAQPYAFEPTPPGLAPDQAQHVLGLEGNLWAERAPQPRVDWQVFPRLCALAEVGWSPPATRDWGNFQRRLDAHYGRLDALGVNYFIAPPQTTTDELVLAGTLDVTFAPVLPGAVIRYTLDGRDPTPASKRYQGCIHLTAPTTVKARVFLPNGRVSHVRTLEIRGAGPGAGVP